MKLSVVATPIGNLEDITLRALRIFKEADLILCEDTRVTRKLLSHYEITTPTLSFHSQSGASKTQKIIELLKEDKHIVLVSDAGTPGVSDPGAELLSDIREACGADVTIESIPGASALTAALAIAGLRVSSFTFYGFLPQKKGRETLFKEIAESERASIFYESPHRIGKALASLEKVVPERRIGIFRELTKMFEESFVGTPAECLEHFKVHPDRERGEFVVMVEGA